MTAIDTNVVVRLITQDDEAQAQLARNLVESTICFVPETVLLESEWVLRSVYGATAAQIGAEFLTLLGLANVRVAHPDLIHQALEWYDDGLDFADALHLAASQEMDSLATFDKTFASRAKQKGDCPVKLLR